MLTPLILALTLALIEAPSAATPPPAPAAVDPVEAEINALLEPYRGKSGDALRGKLGMSAGSRLASDGQIVHWIINAPSDTSCDIEAETGAMRCSRPPASQCLLAMAFDPKGVVKDWVVRGPPEICVAYIGLIRDL